MSTALGTGCALTENPARNRKTHEFDRDFFFYLYTMAFASRFLLSAHNEGKPRVGLCDRSTHGERTDGPAVWEGWLVITIFPPPEATTVSRSCPTSFSKSPNALA